MGYILFVVVDYGLKQENNILDIYPKY